MVFIERCDVAFSNLKDSTQMAVGKILHLIPFAFILISLVRRKGGKITIASEAISTSSRRAMLNRVSRTGNGGRLRQQVSVLHR